MTANDSKKSFFFFLLGVLTAQLGEKNAERYLCNSALINLNSKRLLARLRPAALGLTLFRVIAIL